MSSQAPISLLCCDLRTVAAVLDGQDAVEKHLQVRVAPQWMEEGKPAFAIANQILREHPESAKWLCYLVISSAENRIVGNAGFKGQANEEGIIEIGYEIAPSFRNRGIATMVVNQLTEIARSDVRIKKVIAHTRPEENASVHVLKKSGFVYCGETIDPDEGPAWRWEYLLNAAKGS